MAARRAAGDDPQEALAGFIRERDLLEDLLPLAGRRYSNSGIGWNELDANVGWLESPSSRAMTLTKVTTMVSTETKSSMPPKLQETIERNKREATAIREGIGDPGEALSQFVRETFSLEALLPDPPQQPGDYSSLWDDTDEDDDE